MTQTLKPAVATISQTLGISTSSAQRLIADGLIPVVRVGRQYRIDEEHLARWIANGGAGSFRRHRIAGRALAVPTGGGAAA
ncbi:MAG TPA: helix-turn-helix domain-containing protein [Candidatus Nitrosotalea sp.]|nr:helix-turn-helix domain-containing protein [Candidatus Nitrosotalea sp.]